MTQETNHVVVSVDENAPKYISASVAEDIEVRVRNRELAGAIIETIDGKTQMSGYFREFEEAEDADYKFAVSGLGNYAISAGIPELSICTKSIGHLNTIKAVFGEANLNYSGIDPNGPFKDSPLELPITTRQVSLSLRRMARLNEDPYTSLNPDDDYFDTRINLGNVDPAKLVKPIVERIPFDSED